MKRLLSVPLMVPVFIGKIKSYFIYNRITSAWRQTVKEGGVTIRRLTMVFFFVVIFLLWNVSIVAAQFFEAGVQKLETPIEAPNFTLKELGGGKISLNELRGKVTLVTFSSLSCSPCQKLTSSFEKLDEVIKSKEVVLLIVAMKGRQKDLLKYKEKFNVSIPILIDEDESVAKAYRIRGRHETFFINREGKIVGKTFAEKDWTSGSMKNLIGYLLKEDR